jgi:hypothetical protein
MLLTRVVFSGVVFHKIIAPATKPEPLAVIVKLCVPTVAELGLTNDRTEDDVWMERFVLYCEQAEDSPHAKITRTNQLREHIRTRSSRATLPVQRADKNASLSIQVLRKSETFQFCSRLRALFSLLWR